MGSISYGTDPYGVSETSGKHEPYRVSPPSGKKWTMTFDDEFTQDRSINKKKWNGGAGGTDWCSLNFNGVPGGASMFGEDPNEPCEQHYDGITLTRTNGRRCGWRRTLVGP